MTTNKIFQVKALWDNEAHVWVAMSDDIPGLITESETFEELVMKLKIVIPELLEANGMMSDSHQKEVSFQLLSERTETAICSA